MSKERMRGMIAGAATLTLFGGWWCIAALANWTGRPDWSTPAASVITIVLLSLCVLRFMAFRKIPTVEDPVAAAKGKHAGRLFGIIFGIEGGLIALCSILLASRNLGLWIPIAIAIIVGMHFLPLAHVFKVPLYYWTGVLSLLGVLGCLLISNVYARLLWVGLVMAAVLWLSVVLLLLQTRPTRSVRV